MRKYIIGLIAFIVLVQLVSPVEASDNNKLTIVITDRGEHRVEIYKSGILMYTDWTTNGVLNIDNISQDYYTVVVDGKYIKKITPLDSVVVFSLQTLPIDIKDGIMIVFLVVFLVGIYAILSKGRGE